MVLRILICNAPLFIFIATYFCLIFEEVYNTSYNLEGNCTSYHSGYLNLIDLITLTVLSEQYKLRKSSL